MIPMCTRWISFGGICERVAGIDWTLSCANWTIKSTRADLILAMEVKRGRLIPKRVSCVDYNRISYIRFNNWHTARVSGADEVLNNNSRPLTINTDDWSSKSVRCSLMLLASFLERVISSLYVQEPTQYQSHRLQSLQMKQMHMRPIPTGQASSQLYRRSR